MELLRHAKTKEIIEQAPDGLLMLGKLGEQLVQARDFYPLFTISQEWKLVRGSKPLGSIPLSNPVAVDNLVLFAGRRWRIISVDEKAHVIDVEAHKGGQVPKFETPLGEEVHTRLIAEMKTRLSKFAAYRPALGLRLLASKRRRNFSYVWHASR